MITYLLLYYVASIYLPLPVYFPLYKENKRNSIATFLQLKETGELRRIGCT